MFHFVCFLKRKKKPSYIKEMLSVLFDVTSENIGSLLSPGLLKLRFESRDFNTISEFDFELNVYVQDKESILELKMYNNLLFGKQVSLYVDDEVLIDDESDDSYQWLLIDKERLFLVEECDDDKSGISLIQSSKKELLFEKALLLLPNKEDIDNLIIEKPRPYFISPSSLWKTCLK